MQDKDKSQEIDKDDIIIVDGVEYIRKNKRELLEEPVIVEDSKMERLDE